VTCGAIGWSDEMLAKLAVVGSRGVEAIKIARAAGVKIGLGTDLLGEMHIDQSREFKLRAPAMSIAESLRSATYVNAEILNQSGQIGVIAPGALADLIVVDGDPLADPTLLESQGRHLSVIMQGGRFHKRALP
jgi:imidazolonepropionase-like amidohydrolase